MSEKLIYNKLFTEDKVELSSEKVELALVDDFAKKVVQGEKSASAYVGNLQKAKDQVKGAIAIFEKAIDMAQELKAKAADLGLDITKDKTYKTRLDIANAKLDRAKKTLKALDSI